MKTIFKILIILVAAVLVGGLLYGAVTAFSSNTSQAQATDSLPPDGEFDRPSPDGESSDLQFPFDSVKNLLIISAVGAIYLNAPKLFGKRKPQPEIA